MELKSRWKKAGSRDENWFLDGRGKVSGEAGRHSALALSRNMMHCFVAMETQPTSNQTIHANFSIKGVNEPRQYDYSKKNGVLARVIKHVPTCLEKEKQKKILKKVEPLQPHLRCLLSG